MEAFITSAIDSEVNSLSQNCMKINSVESIEIAGYTEADGIVSAFQIQAYIKTVEHTGTTTFLHKRISLTHTRTCFTQVQRESDYVSVGWWAYCSTIRLHLLPGKLSSTSYHLSRVLQWIALFPKGDGRVFGGWFDLANSSKVTFGMEPSLLHADPTFAALSFDTLLHQCPWWESN